MPRRPLFYLYAIVIRQPNHDHSRTPVALATSDRTILMRLVRLEAENFRRFREMRLLLASPITVLIGPNGAGKSNVVDAALLLRDSVYGGSAVHGLSPRGGF